MKELYIDVCDLKNEVMNLCIGDIVFISGEIYTARDAAHKRIFEALEKGEDINSFLKIKKEYEDAYEKRKIKIDSLYNEIKTIKKLKVW